MEENLDVSIHRGHFELSHEEASGEGQLLDQAAARGDPNGRASSSACLLPPRRSSSSDDDSFERWNGSPDISAEVISLRNRLRESEEKRRELEQALAQRKAEDEEAKRRKPNDKLSAAAKKEIKQLQEELNKKDRKLDDKRREIMRLQRHVQVYERDFVSLNERARAAEANANGIETGWSTIRNFLYARNLGLDSPSSSEGLMDLNHLRRQADRGVHNVTYNDAYNEAHNRNTQSQPAPRAQRTASSLEDFEDDPDVLPSRPGYCRLEADSSGSAPGRVEASDDEETLILQSGSSLSLSVSGNEVACCTDDLEQLEAETLMVAIIDDEDSGDH